MATMQSRRRFVTNAAVAGAAGLGAFVAALGAREPSWAAEPPPEITTLRLGEWPVTCGPQQWVAPALLHAEGFGDVQYYTWGAQKQDWAPQVLVSGDVDISVSFIPADLMFADSGEPVVWLAGSHIGCVELVANERVHSARDLKGKTVGIGAAGDLGYIFTAMFASYVGLDPRKDINWFVDPRVNVEQLAEGKFDAIMIGPPDSVAAREKKIGHALVSTTTDKPWSQYLCCMYSSTQAFVRRYPVATKRALRALLKASDLCASEPEQIARIMAIRDVPPSYTNWRYEYILQGLKEIPYGQWRDYDPEDALRWHALWMRDLGMIKNTPQKLIAEHAEWSFLNELKRELKT
jgi:NitT/TauT family transport system substrate-binding protein